MAKGESDADMAVAETIIERRNAKFDPGAFRDRYQDALRELTASSRAWLRSCARSPSRRRNLMDALKRSLPRAAAAEAEARDGCSGSAATGHVIAGLGGAKEEGCAGG
jgi:DNA end-binding protein Ku